MGRVIAVGNGTLDIINLVAEYPQEDQEVRASAQHYRRGGNACNTLAVLSQLGHHCSWAGTLADEPDAAIILADLKQHRIDCTAVHTVKQGKVPTSYISLSRLNGSRTIVHYRDLPEYSFALFSRIDLNQFHWLHFEGRNIAELHQMMKHARNQYPELSISLEVEKVRDGIEKLFGLADLILFSREYAQHQGAKGAEEFLLNVTKMKLKALATCTWGDKGAWATDHNGKLLHAPAFIPVEVVDTLGAGDTFNAGMIHQLLQGHDLEHSLTEASRLAGKKCGVEGLNGLCN